MNLSLIPDVVEHVVYHSTVKLTFNLFYKALGNLDGLGIVAGTSNSNGTDTGSGRAIQLDRSSLFTMNSESQQLRSSWRSFQSSVDYKPLEELADTLLRNKAINQSLVPDPVERQLYLNCLKIMFWIFDIITSSVKLTFCGHTIAMTMNSASVTKRYIGSREQGQPQNSTIDLLVNRETTRSFSDQLESLLEMDGCSPWDECGESSKRSKHRGLVQDGFTWLKQGVQSSITKLHKDMVKTLNLSLYGLILAIVDDLLKSTKIDILSDSISLRVSNMQSKSKSRGNENDVLLKTEAMWQVHDGLHALGFETERELLNHRFQEWTPEQRAAILKDLSSSM